MLTDHLPELRPASFPVRQRNLAPPTSNKPKPYLPVLRLQSYKVNTAYDTVRSTVIVIFRSCDPADGYSPCSPFTYCTVRAVDFT